MINLLKTGLVLIVSSCLFFSCTKTNTGNASKLNTAARCPSPAPVTVNVGYQQTAAVFNCAGDQLEVNFNQLIGDSRCALGVVCPWAGQANAGFVFSGSTQQVDMELGKTTQFTWDGHTITAKFIELNPYPVYNVPTNINDYVAKIEFSSN